jgi:hypothetical protein
MSIEDYQDRIFTRLQKAGATDDQLNSETVHMLVAHCHMKGLSVTKAATGILNRLREESRS